MSTRVRICLTLALLLVGTYGSYSFWRLYRQAAAHSASSEPSPPARPVPLGGFTVPEFSLLERSGKPFHSADLKGRVWVASFFFTNCSGACLKLNGSIAELQEELADEGVRFVSISVDPENDTPERLRSYASHYQADPDKWLFLTGEEEAVSRVAEECFKVPFAQTLHSDRLIVVDRQGRVEGYYSSSDPTQMAALKRKLKALLAETS